MLHGLARMIAAVATTVMSDNDASLKRVYTRYLLYSCLHVPTASWSRVQVGAHLQSTEA